MPDLPQFLYVLVDNPTLIVIPIILFAVFALWTHSRTAWVATAAWNAYLVYELGMKAGEFCGDTCLKRTPLYVAYPLLVALSLLALLQGYVRIRDKRQRERLAATSPPTPQTDPLVLGQAAGHAALIGTISADAGSPGEPPGAQAPQP